MPRQIRIIVPNEAHHITQRGNYRQVIFTKSNDFRQYLIWLDEYSKKYHIDILAYCVMNNHNHFIVIPHNKKSLPMAFNALTMRYAQYVNRKRKTCGHVWQGRYFSCVLDEKHLYRAIRYVETNPVRAKIVGKPWDYQWSSAPIHVGIETKQFVGLKESLAMNPREWKAYLCQDDGKMANEIRLKTKRGLVIGSDRFIKKLEKELKRSLRCLNPGRPKKGS